MSEVILYDYQGTAVEMVRDGIRAGHRKQVLMSPTGSGKTEIACYMLQEAQRKLSRSLFIVDRVVLVDQTSERLDRYGISHGVMQAQHWRCRPWEKIQVCSAQTIEKRGIPEGVDLVFIDEAHSMRKKVTEFVQATGAIVVGLTATPFTKGMAKIYSNLVNVTTMNKLIADGFLVPLKMYAAKSINVAGMKVVAGEWSDHDIETRGMEIIGDVVSEWVDKTEKHFGGPVKTIVFSATVNHGAEICAQFQAAGFNFKQISYKDGGDEYRREVIAEFRKADSTIDGLVSCEVFTKGFDVADVRCGISARPYRKSLSSHIQQMGRIMRSSPGKEYGLWLDHSGNAIRFMADTQDIFENGLDVLDDGKLEDKTRKEPDEKEKGQIACSCGYIMNAMDESCPSCGKVRKRLNLVETLPGQMVEIDGTKANKLFNWEQKIAFIGGLKSMAQARGYQPGWVAHQYHGKFGVWPNDPRVKHAAPCEMTIDLHNWLRSQQIRNAKRRA